MFIFVVGGVVKCGGCGVHVGVGTGSVWANITISSAGSCIIGRVVAAKVKVTGCIVSVVPCQVFGGAGGRIQAAIIGFSGVVSGCAAAGRTGVAVGGVGCRVGECVGIVAWGCVLGSVPRLIVRNHAPGTAVPFRISGIEEAVVGIRW